MEVEVPPTPVVEPVKVKKPFLKQNVNSSKGHVKEKLIRKKRLNQTLIAAKRTSQ